MSTEVEKFLRGSEWRKWDLHVHSLYTHLENEYSTTKETDFIKKVIDEHIEVVGLTNYFNFKDEDFSLKDKLEKKGVTVFLNLEIRLSYQNKEDECCDAHIVFDSATTKVEIENFLTQLNVTCKDGEKIAKNLVSKDEFKTATVDFEDILETLNQESLGLCGRYLIGFLSRGKGNGRTSTNYEKLARRSHFLIHSTDKVKNVEEDREFWLAKEKPLLQSSDAHNLKSVGKKFTWIKADPTFEGLKQIVHEPAERVAIQSIHPQKVADSYCIDKITYSLGDEQETININPYLNSVIGVRASGKSTLLKNVASKIDRIEFNTKSKEESFLEIDNLKITWSDGEEDAGTNESKTILYIPQNFLSGLVHDRDASKTNLTDFIKELFERNSTFKSKLSIWESSNQQLDKKIYDALSNLFDFDSKLNKANDFIKKEGLSSDVEKNIKQIELDIGKVKKESKLSEDVLSQYKKNKSSRAKHVVNLETTEQDIESLKHLLGIGLINMAVVSDLDLSEGLEQKVTKNLAAKNTDITKFIKKEIESLEEKVRKISKDIKDLDEKIKPVESKLKKGSLIKDLAERLSAEKNRLARIAKLNIDKKELSKKITSTKKDILTLFSQREKVLDSAIKDFKDFGAGFEFIKLKINKYSRNKEFGEFCEKINFHKKSPFKDKKTIHRKAFDFLQTRQLEDDKDLAAVVSDLFSSIFDDELPLNSSTDKQEFLLRLLSNWYDINYKDSVRSKVDDTKLLDMSDGQKMNSLLELLFSFDDYTFPILIDQPEDDLDVTAITELVVKFVREKKKQRQIILVSHNANLVIGSDTENIIVAHKEIERRKIKGFMYHTGSVENKGIRSETIQTLEGGAEAFKKRGQKLGII